MPNEILFVKSSFTPQLRGINLVPPVVKSWSEASDAELAEYLQKHYAGEINLHDYWNIGDTKTVRLSAIPATGVEETHVEQDIELQLVNAGGKELTNGAECAFIVQLKNVLSNASIENVYLQAETGKINKQYTSIGGWKNSNRRQWCNNAFKNALPETTKNLFKAHKNKTSQGNAVTALEESQDFFALPCTYNIFGEDYNALPGEDNVHWTYYNTQEKRIKYNSANAPIWWWLRSPYAYSAPLWMLVNASGESDFMEANVSYGIAPFGTI